MIQLCGHSIGPKQRLMLFAGPDVIESADMVRRHAQRLKQLCEKLCVPLVFKCSFDKANRTSAHAYRGPGIEEGLRILKAVKDEVGVPILTDVHETWQVPLVAEVADVLQVPAFLCRQTDLIVAVAKTGKVVNLKKGQFVSPKDMWQAAQKAVQAGNAQVIVTERGASFGYGNLVVDMRSLAILKQLGLATCFDATHSVQLPSAEGGKSGGERAFVAVLARAAAAAGMDALFAEVHETPETALCDGPCSLTFEMLEEVLGDVLAIRKALRYE
ncbi:MAG: 3-deoxy-8-phosphooctulonate synthase [Proteobacteria bacterium]|nr:3-deoxy-8-phosphooctulonate synthase [Cystobacterineae bacterium]MCL2314158.1 3-deoxy-8-phosphooctulonate synthase [Pseudomonadota bacterium]